MREIPLSKGKVTFVDAEDFDKVNQFKWTYTEPGYAYRNQYTNGQRKRIYLHRFILEVDEKGIVVDHIDGNKLNNTRNNLRKCTHKENLRNSKISSDNTSGYKGVSWDKNRGKWISYLSADGKFKTLGRYECRHAAANSYNEAAKVRYGDFARLNEVERCNCDACLKNKKQAG